MLKTVMAGVLAFGLFGSAIVLPVVDASQKSNGRAQVTEQVKSQIAKPTCCAKRAYCCKINRPCCR